MGTYKCSERTRKKIYRAAQELFLEHGYDNTSLADIARKAQVSTGTLYRYYPTKQHLLLYAADDVIAKMKALREAFTDDMSCKNKIWSLMSSDMRDCLDAFSYEAGSSTKSNRDSSQFGTHLVHRSAVYSSPDAFSYAYQNRAIMAQCLEEILEEGIADGEIEAETPTHDVADILVAIFFHQYDLALLDPLEEGSLQAFKRKVLLVLNSLAPERY